MPFFSIIIPCYNVSNFVDRSIQSVLEQEYSNYELILIDDASKDATPEILEGYSSNDKIRVLQNKSNAGVSFSRNRGISVAEGEYVLFLDGDDTYEKNLLKDLKKFLDLNKGLDLVSFGYSIQEENRISHLGKSSYKEHIFKSEAFLKLYLSRSIRQHLCSIAVRREMLFENSIFFDERTFAGEDQEFQIRAMLHSREIGYMPQEYFNYIIRKSSFMHASFSEKRLTVMDAIKRLNTHFLERRDMYPHFINYASMEYFSLLKHALKSDNDHLVHQTLAESWILEEKSFLFLNKQAVGVALLKKFYAVHKAVFLLMLRKL